MRCRPALAAIRLAFAFFTAVVPVAAVPPVRMIGRIGNPTVLDHPTGLIRADAPISVGFDLMFDGDKPVPIRLQLEPNDDLLPAGASVIRMTSSGELVERTRIHRPDHRIFRGLVWMAGEPENSLFAPPMDRPVGSVRVSFRRHSAGASPVFEGSFDIAHDGHHVEVVDGNMVVYRDSDIEQDHADLLRGHDHSDLRRRTGAARSLTGCGVEDLPFNQDPTHPVWAHAHKQRAITPARLGRRQDTVGGGNSALTNLLSSIGSTTGCPTTRKIALVGVATDCSYSQTFNSTDAARDNIIAQFNAASAVFERSFNIALGLHTLVVSDLECPASPPSSAPWNSVCSDSTSITDRLSLFSQWRGQRGDDGQSHWTLMTTCRTGTAVGLAWLGQACVSEAFSANETDGSTQVVSGANVIAKVDPEWQVIAHETGHTFGAVHDCTLDVCADSAAVAAQQCCPLNANTCDAGENYIMNPSTAAGITDFSPCSIGNICSAFGHNAVKSSCFTNNRNIDIITGPQCGNGIVEVGEDCDCGGTEGCGGNVCCDPTTCKFASTAVCDDSNDDCCSSCQFASSGTVCRASNGFCDPAETCSGSSASCPTNHMLDDGTACGNSSAPGFACASGQCTSRNAQCASVMGTGKTACDSESCTLACTTSGMSSIFSTSCLLMNQNFLDGTPCSAGGRCQNGKCIGSKTWLEQNKKIVIIVAAAVGGLLALTILWCVVRSCMTRRAIRNRAVAASAAAAAAAAGGRGGSGMPRNYAYPRQNDGAGMMGAPVGGPGGYGKPMGYYYSAVSSDRRPPPPSFRVNPVQVPHHSHPMHGHFQQPLSSGGSLSGSTMTHVPQPWPSAPPPGYQR